MNEREKYAYDYLLKKGWSPAQSAGVVGNLVGESGRGLNPELIHDGGTGIGIAGWRDPSPGQGRKTQLTQFAASMGKSATDFDAQLSFLDHELRTTESAAGNKLRAATTPEAAAVAFLDYERPGGWKAGDPTKANGYQNRQNDAKRLFAAYSGVDIQPSDRSPTRPITVPEQMASENAPGPGLLDTAGAAIGENSLTAWLLDKPWLLPDDPDYELTDDRLKVLTTGIPQDHWSAFEEAHSADQAEHIRRQLMEQMDRQKTLSEAGITGTLASFAASMGDPIGLGVGLVSGGVGNAVMWGSKLSKLQRVAAAAAGGAAINAGLTAAEESLKPLPEWDAVLLSAAGGAVMGAGFGALSKMPHMAEEADTAFRLAKADVEEVEAKYGAEPIRPKDTSAGAAMAPERVPLMASADDLVRLADDQNAPKAAFGKVRFDATGSTKKNDNPAVRMMGNVLGEDAVGHFDKELNTVWTAGEERFKLQTKMATKQARALEPNFQNWAKDKGLTTPWAREQVREEFNREVTRAMRNMDPTQTFDPHVMKAAHGMRDWFDTYHALASDPGAPDGLAGQIRPPAGFGPGVKPAPNYVNRVFDYRKLTDAYATFGHGVLGDVVATAMRRLNPDVEPALLAKIGRGYVKKMRELSKGMNLRASGAMFSGDDLEGLRGLLHDLSGVDPEDAESLLAQMARPTDKATVSRAKHRVLLDESLRLEMPGGTVTTFAELFLEEDIAKLATSYNHQMAGNIAMARLRVEKMVDGERHLLIDGITHQGEWDAYIQKVRAVSDDIGQDRTALEDGIAKLDYLAKSVWGVPLHDPNTKGNHGLRLWREYGFSRVMGQVGFAQVSEFGNMFGMAGFKAAWAGMPSYRALVRDARTGQLKDGLADEIEAVWGLGAERLRSAGDYRITGEGEWGAATYGSPRMQSVEKGLGVAKRVTMEVSGLNAINTFLHRWSTSAILHWFSRAASGDITIPMQRLRSLDLTDEMAERVFNQMRTHRTLKEGSSFKLARLNLDSWDDLQATAHFERAVSRRGARMVQSNTPGMFAPWMQHPVALTMLQFRTFVIGAHSKQMLHNLHMWDRESVSTLIVTMLTAQLGHIAQTVANAPSLSEKQLEERLSVKGIALGGFQRTGMTALLPMMIDTTMLVAGQKGVFDSRSTGQPSNIFGNPTTGLIDDIPNAINAIVQPLAQGRQVSRQEMKAMLRPLIWQNTLPLTTLFGVMSQGRPEFAPNRR